MRRLVIAIGCFGCTGEGGDDTPRQELGQARFCLESDVEVVPTTVGDSSRWDVAGTVVGVDSAEKPAGEAPFTCIPATGRTLDVRDADDHVWRVGWYATSGGEDRTPATSVAVDDVVSITFLHVNDFADDSALVVRDDDGLLLAGEEGFGQRIDDVDPGLIDGLSVERGDADASLFYENDCGRFTPQDLVFAAGGASTTVSTWEEASVVVGGVDLQARNVGAYDYVGDIDCTDTWGPMPWLAFR